MDDTTTIVLQILSILVSGGALQFITFLIKRSDDIRKLGLHQDDDDDVVVAKPTHPTVLFAGEQDLISRVIANDRQITVLKTKLRKCRRDLSAVKKNA